MVQLVYERDDQRVTTLERVLDGDLTARGIIASIDASLRDLNARIVRNERLNVEDTQQIAACEAELERTSVQHPGVTFIDGPMSVTQPMLSRPNHPWPTPPSPLYDCHSTRRPAFERSTTMC